MADFFDKMLDGINRGVNSVATGSKNMFEKAKINSTISNLENEKRQLAEMLGAKVYNMYKEGTLTDTESFGELCSQIDGKIEEIQANKRELEKLETPPAPPVPPVPPAPYGTPETASVYKAEDAGVVFCPHCGFKNEGGSKFCASCGLQLM